MKIKRIIAMLLVAVMAFSIIACSGDDELSAKDVENVLKDLKKEEKIEDYEKIEMSFTDPDTGEKIELNLAESIERMTEKECKGEVTGGFWLNNDDDEGIFIFEETADAKLFADFWAEEEGDDCVSRIDNIVVFGEDKDVVKTVKDALK